MSPRETWCDPGHWAVFAFATTSFMLGFVNSGFIGGSAVYLVLPVALIFGGLVQLLVAILEVMRDNTFGACVFGTYGPFWIIYGLFVQFYAGSIAKVNANSAVALFLAMFAVLTFFFVVASLRTDWVLVAVFVLIDVALILLAWGNDAGLPELVKVGGYVTIAFAVLAWYHAFAGLVNATFGRKSFPVGFIGPFAPREVEPTVDTGTTAPGRGASPVARHA